MEQTEAERIRHMSGFLQYIYLNAKNKDDLLSHIKQPVALYDRDGKIVQATEMFRSLAGITHEDIEQGKANILDCLIGELLEAVCNVQNLKSFDNLSRPLRVKSPATEEQAAAYTHAAIFPVSVNTEDPELSAVYLLKEETEAERKDKYVLLGMYRV